MFNLLSLVVEQKLLSKYFRNLSTLTPKIKKIINNVVRGDISEGLNNDCAVCFNQYSNLNQIAVLACCGNILHMGCLNQISNQKCPMCSSKPLWIDPILKTIQKYNCCSL